MRRRQPLVVAVLVVSLTLVGGFNPAFANGLISTERLLAQPAAQHADGLGDELALTQRGRLQAGLVAAGVDPAQVEQRVAALTDAEIAELSQRIDSAPAGGVWFMPFLIVAAVIGVLIGAREAEASAPRTNLFGRPRDIAIAP